MNKGKNIVVRDEARSFVGQLILVSRGEPFLFRKNVVHMFAFISNEARNNWQQKSTTLCLLNFDDEKYFKNILRIIFA